MRPSSRQRGCMVPSCALPPLPAQFAVMGVRGAADAGCSVAFTRVCDAAVLEGAFGFMVRWLLGGNCRSFPLRTRWFCGARVGKSPSLRGAQRGLPSHPPCHAASSPACRGRRVSERSHLLPRPTPSCQQPSGFMRSAAMASQPVTAGPLCVCCLFLGRC